MEIRALETHYAGCRFRSRLEARWAVFFTRMGIRWEYEPQGFVIGGRPYLPDFLLADTGTWVEVKGSESELDHELMEAAAVDLPSAGNPVLLILGPIPEPPSGGDWAWLGFGTEPETAVGAFPYWLGFGSGCLSLANETSCAPPSYNEDDLWLAPGFDMRPDLSRAADAYRAARSARFEHGEKGAA